MRFYKEAPEHVCDEGCYSRCQACGHELCSMDPENFPMRLKGYSEDYCTPCYEKALVAEILTSVSTPLRNG